MYIIEILVEIGCILVFWVLPIIVVIEIAKTTLTK